MKWQFPIFSYFWLVLCVTHVSCFLPLSTLPLNRFDRLTKKSSCHLRDTCYRLSFHRPHPCMVHHAQKALPSPATAGVGMTRLFVLCCPLGKNVSLPFLAHPLLERKASETENIVSAVALSAFTHKVPIPLSTGLGWQAPAGGNLTDSPKPLPSSDQSFISGSTSRLDVLSIRTKRHQRSPGTMSEGQPGMPSPQIRTS